MKPIFWIFGSYERALHVSTLMGFWWYMKWIIQCIIWTGDMKSSEAAWSSQLWTQFLQLRKEAWKIQDFNGVWTCDLVIAVRHSNQLSYEANDVESWSFVGSNVPVSNESMMKWYMKWIIYELRIWNQVKLWSLHIRTPGNSGPRLWHLQAEHSLSVVCTKMADNYCTVVEKKINSTLIF